MLTSDKILKELRYLGGNGKPAVLLVNFDNQIGDLACSVIVRLPNGDSRQVYGPTIESAIDAAWEVVEAKGR